MMPDTKQIQAGSRRARRLVALGLCMAGAIALASPSSQAQTYPNKPVRLVVPSGAGGNVDLTARILAQRLRAELGQEVLVDDRPGANGNIGDAFVAHSRPDGYILTMASAAQLTINPFIYEDIGFDPQKDLTPISLIATGPMVLDANLSLHVNTVGDLVALAKSKPGALNSASGGNGSLSHLSLEMFKLKTDTSIVHVPYKATAEALNDLLSGQVQMMFDTFGTSLPYIKSGKIKALAVTGPKRAPLLPDVPTVQEVGITGYAAESWMGVLGPAGLPQPIVARLNTAINAALADPDVKARVAAMGNETIAGTPQQFADTLAAELAKWSDIVKSAQIPKLQ